MAKHQANNNYILFLRMSNDTQQQNVFHELTTLQRQKNKHRLHFYFITTTLAIIRIIKTKDALISMEEFLSPASAYGNEVIEGRIRMKHC